MMGVDSCFFHEPVLLAETIAALRILPEGSYIDCTVGGGGHAEAILERLGPSGRLLGLDVDREAIAYAAARLRRFGDALVLVQANFRDVAMVARQHGFDRVQGVLFDLGVSAHQLLTSYRGFSLQLDAPLDMRFSPEQELTAADLVNTLSEQELADLIYRFGEEPRSRRIAKAIVNRRPVTTTGQLAGIVAQAVGRARGRTHPATRTFQALRIAVNQELDALRSGLTQAVDLLLPAGRLVVISFHSLEDRIVKDFVRTEAAGCICPPEVPVCACGHQARLKPLYRGVVKPSAAEVERNPRSRSARLRAAERL